MACHYPRLAAINACAMQELKKLQSQQLDAKQSAAAAGSTATVGEDVSDDTLRGMNIGGIGGSGWEQTGNITSM